MYVFYLEIISKIILNQEIACFNVVDVGRTLVAHIDKLLILGYFSAGFGFVKSHVHFILQPFPEIKRTGNIGQDSVGFRIIIGQINHGNRVSHILTLLIVSSVFVEDWVGRINFQRGEQQVAFVTTRLSERSPFIFCTCGHQARFKQQLVVECFLT
ncbi:hypothetical protein SDC9_192630 [bioreactor metagenome]|uniref:Uncharacterized protein n=1 Tax=bioreactor metagenome TaxID=1076179 RepID=A0A645ICA8_9ZZZZ